MKRVGDPVKLRLVEWDGEFPVPGDVLQTLTGRSYLILSLSRRAPPAGVHALVIDPAEITPAHRVHGFYWIGRRRQRLAAMVR